MREACQGGRSILSVNANRYAHGGHAEEDRSRKAHRLSNGSRASPSRASPSTSPDGSTDGSMTASTGASGATTYDQEDDGDGDVAELAVDQQVANDHDGEKEEEGQESAPAQRSGAKGKGKRRAEHVDDLEPEEDENEEEEEGEDGLGEAEEEHRLAVPVGGVDTDAGAGAVTDEEASSPITETGRTKKRKKRKKRPQSEAGVVLKVYAENFMCHRKLTVQFCKRMNFINGRNGSGKSAILAALQICLGARAHLTHRAKKMTDFIRHGWKGDAVIEVTLLNNKYGFKFEEYGDSITVRRTIKQPSGGSFALLGRDKVVKSRDKADLFRMLDVFNIQVDNPCAVLEQENSKKFLQGNAQDKYSFLMRAADLDQIHASIKATEGEIAKMKIGCDRTANQAPKHKAIIRQLKAERKEHQDLESLKMQILDIKERIAWAVVGEFEEERDRLAESLKETTIKIERLQERLSGLEAEAADLAASKDEVKQRFNAKLAETARLQQEVKDTSLKLKGAQQPLLALRGQRSALEEEKNEKKAGKEAAKEKLKAARNMRRRTLDDNEKNVLDRIQRVDDSLANVARANAARGGAAKILELRAAVQMTQDGADNAKAQLGDASQDLTGRRAELSELESGVFNPLSAIGNYMPALCRRITQEAGRGRFRSPPVGPLGASIHLKEAHKLFRVCIEGHLSKNVTNFVVSCQQDKTTLMGIMAAFRGNRTWRLPAIIVQMPQDRYRPPQNPPGYLQIMQAINVTDDQAFNCLVDQCSIEKMCLFTCKEEAEKACLSGASGRYQRMPYGMFQAYYPSQGGRSCNWFKVSDGNLQTRMNVVNSDMHRRVLGVDQATQLREARARFEQATAAVARVRAEADAVVANLNRAKAALEQEEAERDELERQESQLGKEKDSLSTELMALQAKKNDATDPTEELERELQVATEELEDVVKQLESLEAQIIEVSATIDPFEKASENARKAHEESSEAAKKIHHELEEREARESEQSRKAVRAQALLAKLNGELEELSTRTKEAGDRVEKEEESAKQIMQNTRVVQGRSWDGQRLTPGASSEALRIKLGMRKERLEKQKQKRKLKSGSLEEVTERLMGATKHLLDMEDLADTLAANMKLLSDEKNRRLPQWKAMRDYVTRNLSDRFNKYLLKRGASGEVTIDHKEKTMGMAYQKDYMDDSNQCDDVRQLSGGERSSATLAMLLAIGESNECPFRVMDEFDVFMDPMSRNWAIKQVIEFAASQKIRQFIFITPQDLSSVTASETCRVIRMQPPRKGDHTQTTLEESFGGASASEGLPDVVDILDVRFERWSKPGDDNAGKMMLLYLPGIEGLGTSVEPQLPALSAKFDVFRLVIGAEDRSTFSTLSRAVTDFIDLASAVGEGTEKRKTVILGESFGAMLGIRLGQLRPEQVQAVFSVNPATSFGRTPWRSLGPLLSLAPKSQYKAASVAVFAATIPDFSQMKSVVDVLVDPNNGLKVTERPKALADRMVDLWGMISEVSENLPPATLRWRIQNWLAAGQGRVERGLGDMKVPVLVIAGSADRLLPSVDEAERLTNLIPGCRSMVLQGHGHAPLFDGRVDMSEIITGDPALEGVVFPEGGADVEAEESKKEDLKSLMAGVYAKDWVNDFVEPDESVIEEGRKTIDFLLKSLSPVFFSTGADGVTVPGLSGVPEGDKSKNRPIIFVGNHQLLALDLGVIVERLYSERDILARGLAHPIVFMGGTTPRALDGVVDGVVKQSEEQNGTNSETNVGTNGDTNNVDIKGGSKEAAASEKTGDGDKEEKEEKDGNGMQTFFTKFGAVPVSPRNMYRLLKRGDNVLLFPGGVSEAYHKKGEDYKLFWPENAEFIRMAVDSDAIIVPFSAIGIADSLNMVLDGDELLELPYIGERLKKSSAATPSARGGSSKEQFVSPFVLPKLPSRVYVRFGEAISLQDLNRRDKVACQEAYERVKDEVEVGIDSLLRAREQDPYLDPPTRLLYERVKGEPAPTFPAPVLDAAVLRTRLAKEGRRRREREKGISSAINSDEREDESPREVESG
eukprot:g11436.t1